MNMKKIIFTLVLLVNTLSKAGDYVSAEITVQDTTTMPIGGGPFPFLVQNISNIPMNINIWGHGWITIDAGVGVPTPRNLGSSGALYSVKVQRADNTGNIAELSGFDDWGWHQLFISLSADGKTPLLYLTASSGGIVGQGGWLAGIPRYFPTSTGTTLTNVSTTPTPIATSTPAQQLIAAVRANNGSQVQTLLQQGANPNALDEHNNSAIANAAARGYLSIVETLRNAGGFKQDPNACTWALKAPGGIVVQAQLINALQICNSQVGTLCNSQVNISSLQTAQDSLVNLRHIQSVNANFCVAEIAQVNTAIAQFQTFLPIGQGSNTPVAGQATFVAAPAGEAWWTAWPTASDQQNICSSYCKAGGLTFNGTSVACHGGIRGGCYCTCSAASTPTPAPIAPIIAAVRANNSSQVQTLLQQGANPNALDENGNSAIANAASKGYVAIINVLKAKGADKTIAGSGGQNACYWALNPVISLTVAQQADVFIALGCPIEPLCEKQVNTSSSAAAQESLVNLTTIGTGACSQQITSVNNAIQSFQASPQDITCLCLWKPGQMAEAPLMQTTAAGQNPCDLCQTVCDNALRTSTPLVGYVPGHYGAVTAVPWAQWGQCRPATTPAS